jgi:hypothetical protein
MAARGRKKVGGVATIDAMVLTGTIVPYKLGRGRLTPLAGGEMIGEEGWSDPMAVRHLLGVTRSRLWTFRVGDWLDPVRR